MDIVGGLVSMASGISWLVAERSGPEAYATRLKDRFIRPLVGRRVRAVIANSEGGRDVWRQAARRGVPVTVIRNTLPLDEIHATKATPLSDVGVSSSTPVVIFVGRLTPEKNIDVLRDVAQRVVSRSTAVVLICGDGPLRQMLEDSVRSSQLDDRIKLLGYRSDVAGLLKSARVFVSTSSFEGNPNAVLEAMACRVSLVVSDISAHREFLDESSAALVSVTDRERFAREIIDAVNGSPESRGRTANAFARVSMLTPATAARQYVDVYQQVLEKHS